MWCASRPARISTWRLHGSADGNGSQKFLDQLEREVAADRFDGRGRLVNQVGAAAQIDDRADERLIHRDVSEAIASDALLLAQCLANCLPEGDARIFHGVMKIDFNITLGVEIEIEESMPGKERQHVIKKRDAGMHVGHPRSVEIQACPNGRFARGSLDDSLAGHAVMMPPCAVRAKKTLRGKVPPPSRSSRFAHSHDRRDEIQRASRR